MVLHDRCQKKLKNGLALLMLLVTLTLPLLLGGCATKMVQVSDTDEFNLMARRIKPVLQNRNLVDAEGAYVSSLFSSEPEQMGQVLFERLSPAFRFQVDPSLLPPTFAAARSPSDSVEIRSSGFVLGQGTEVVSVRLLALADWDETGSTDWILLCRVQNLAGTVLRDYYLVAENPESPVITPRLLAVYDCLSNSCKLFVDVSGQKEPEFAPEVRVLELDPGQRPVILPPNAPAPEGAVKPGISEQKLGG